jgi:methylase of polypeptide subunit release factors
MMEGGRETGTYVRAEGYGRRVKLAPGDSAELRKTRGAFFTPRTIADHLVQWAINGDPSATVLDPTCGEAVFLLAAGEQLRALGQEADRLDEQLFGIDLHAGSLDAALELLEENGLDARLVESDFFAVETPDTVGARLPYVDAVVGNPPFVRYQEHIGESRRLSVEAALRQGVRLNGLASSWAASVVHAAGFLKPEGRLAMVLPAELLTVGYAEPIRAWLKTRFEKVNLVLFERLQFEDALADVVLLLAEGYGGCDAFSLYHVEGADDLAQLGAYVHLNVTPPSEGKWTDLLLPVKVRSLYRTTAANGFTPLSEYGRAELGIVTGANKFFALSESTRKHFGLTEAQLVPISPPGTRHLKGSLFSRQQWEELRDADERVWLFHPDASDMSKERRAYTDHGEALGVDEAYKCQIRTPWWRPPMVTPPDFFFTYMSHNFPRIIANGAKATFVNSMHGVRLREGVHRDVRAALPLLAMNSVTMLGGEIHGRSYGGGILKMEPREAASLPVPNEKTLIAAWAELKPVRHSLERKLRAGSWSEVVKRVDAAVLGAAGLDEAATAQLLDAARLLRERRLRRGE